MDTKTNQSAQLLHEQAIGKILGSSSMPVSFMSILKEIDHEKFDDINRQLNAIENSENFAHIPIIGVCGMMNSGKSTLVAHHLSTAGQQRVLIGDLKNEGTHRFVLWVPESWKSDADKLELLHHILKNGFGASPEYLSGSVDEAALSYNARDSSHESFHVPLLAFDSRLDEHQIALLDCPDIQRSHDLSSDSATSEVRKTILEKASHLCSAFFLVSSVEQFEDSKLADFFELMGTRNWQLPTYCIITKVHTDRCSAYFSEVLKRLQDLEVDKQVNGIFISPRVAAPPATGYPQGVEYHSEKNQFSDISEVKSQLKPAKLFKDQVSMLKGKITSNFDASLDSIDAFIATKEETANRARAAILGFIKKKFLKPEEGLKPIYTQEFTHLIYHSLIETAPWWLKFQLKALTHFKNIGKFISGSIKNISTLFPNKQELEKTKKKLSEAGVEEVTSHSFYAHINGREWVPQETLEAEMAKVWDASVADISELEIIHSDDIHEDFNEAFRNTWKTITIWQRLKFASLVIIPLLLALATVMIVPFDGGTSTVIFAASVKEILAAAGLGSLVSAAFSVHTAHSINQAIEEQVARPQFSRLFALLQDRLGIPRASDALLLSLPENKQLKLTFVDEEDLYLRNPVIKVLEDPIIAIDASARKKLSDQIHKLLK
ncbi:hypothetical protein [Rubritalea sp.]|uniref:hypothetical protein n=1 Tax=Rubritalea sp. TaxID=2109375 RepID=UPI003EF1F882